MAQIGKTSFKHFKSEDNAISSIDVVDENSTIFDFSGNDISTFNWNESITNNDLDVIGIKQNEWIKKPINVKIGMSINSIDSNLFDNCDLLSNISFNDKTLQEVKSMPGYPFGINEKIIATKVIDGYDVKLLNGNYIQESIAGTTTNYAKNAFVQVDDSTAYGDVFVGCKGYCVLCVDFDNDKIKLSGNLDNLAEAIVDTGKYPNGVPFSWYLYDKMFSSRFLAKEIQQNGVVSCEILRKNQFLCSELSVINRFNTEEQMSSLFVQGYNLLYSPIDPSIGNYVADYHTQHVEGSGVKAIQYYAHAEGRGSIADGRFSHAEGHKSYSGGLGSHAEGFGSETHGNRSHAEGSYSKAYGEYSHAEGRETSAYGEGTHSEGYFTIVSGLSGAHVEGYKSIANGDYSHAECQQTSALGKSSHAEGYVSLAQGDYSHAEGWSTHATKSYSHAEGYNTWASQLGAHAEGRETSATNTYSHAEGQCTLASKKVSHAAGYYAKAQHDYAWCWNGNNELSNDSLAYGSNKNGSFNVNPQNDISGFYIGSQNFINCVVHAISTLNPTQLNIVKTALGIS